MPKEGVLKRRKIREEYDYQGKKKNCYQTVQYGTYDRDGYSIHESCFHNRKLRTDTVLDSSRSKKKIMEKFKNLRRK